MKFIKAFRGVKRGQIYPADFKPGDECPKELQAAAASVGAIPVEKPKNKKAD